jgi:hypothetical protein
VRAVEYNYRPVNTKSILEAASEGLVSFAELEDGDG